MITLKSVSDRVIARGEMRRGQTDGDAGLIEPRYAMTGAAILPGIKRAMGYATACEVSLFNDLKFKREALNG